MILSITKCGPSCIGFTFTFTRLYCKLVVRVALTSKDSKGGLSICLELAAEGIKVYNSRYEAMTRIVDAFERTDKLEWV